jgi:hypothetical protein
MINKPQQLELADIFNAHGDAFLRQHKLCTQQAKAFRAIQNCRSMESGKHASQCDKCGYVKYAYNSCHNRHCPKCQFTKQAKWIDKLKANLPPTRYFHMIFTIPPALHKTFYINQEVCYSLLFKAAAQTVKQCAANPKYLGAQYGAVAVLHTWGQTLTYHPHIHMMVPTGGLSEDNMEWIPARDNFFAPVKAMQKIFRGILCRLIEQSVDKGDIFLPEDINIFSDFKSRLYQKHWNVRVEKPLKGPSRVIEYLGQYTQRVAISNHRLIGDHNGKISFSYKDYKTGGTSRNMTLEAYEFIRRFLQHVLPLGFYKIRYFGILAQSNAKTKTAWCFDLIENEVFLSSLEGLSAIEVYRIITGKDPAQCPNCIDGKMMPITCKERIIEAPG